MKQEAVVNIQLPLEELLPVNTEKKSQAWGAIGTTCLTVQKQVVPVLYHELFIYCSAYNRCTTN